MPIVVEERFESRSTVAGKSPSVELRYWIKGTDDDLAARDALETAAPTEYDGLVRQDVQIEPQGHELWDGTVRYAVPSFGGLQTGESVFSFDTGGGTRHVTQSRQTILRKAPPGQTAPDFKGAIGVTDTGVEGVDIVVPVYNFSETHYLPEGQVTQGYKLTLFGLTGKVNNGSFRGFAAGEVLFLGASGSKRVAPGGTQDWEVTFRFAASPNATGLKVGDITGISKKGWEYLWARYADRTDDDAKALVKRPIAAFVERVYDAGNFGGLGI